MHKLTKEPHITIVQVPIDALKPAEYNPRTWPAKAVSDLKSSIQSFGLIDPILANSAPKRKNVVIGGHFRLHVAKQMGYAAVPVVYVSVPDIAKEKELNLRLNKNNGEWDLHLLSQLDEELLKTVGFDGAELDKIYRGNAAKDPDDRAPLRSSTKIKVGDLYQLGQHRLFCGDATNTKHVEALMGGGLADMVFTDPPYNVNYAGRGKNTSRTIENDNQTEQAFRAFLTGSFASYREYSKPNAPLYTCYASRTHREFEDALNENGYEVRCQIIWVKTVASMGWGDYRWKHEPILYCRQHDAKIAFHGDRTQYTEWTEELSDEDLLKKFKSIISREEAGASTVWRLSRETEYRHPTQKPTKLIAIALYNSSRRGDVVLDLFGGSGSTLMTAQDLGRRCYTMELDPLFCQVIVDTWQEYANEKALKIQ